MMNYTVYPAQIGATPLQYARDWVSGYTGEYIFFRASQDEYYLIRGDIDFDTLSGSDCRIDLIYAAFSANSGSYYQIETFEGEDFTLSNPNDCIIYGSDDLYPSLISGGDKYVFSVLVALCIGFCFCLFDRVLRRLY